MASRKEYEMMFQLNAEMGKSYTSTFSKAQQSLVTMQREIQSLSKTQSDISAFTKQQSAVENTKQKLELLKKQYDNIQQEIKETGNDSSALKNKLLEKQKQIDKTTASLRSQQEKLTTLGSSLREAGVDTSNLTGEEKRLAEQIDAVKREQEEAANSAKDFGDASQNAISGLSTLIASAGIAVALKEIADGFAACVSIAADFEATMSTVEALSGASEDEMEALSEKAKELGATTKFTATESAEAMTYMGMAGWSAEEMLNGMSGVMTLAAASGEDLAMVSDIVTDNLTAFGLKAKDTARFADVLATAATNSNTDVATMGETFKNCASIAGALNYSVEDVATAVGLMANAGVKGSVAGTALKNTFNGLLEGATLTSKAFGEYEFSALKSDGTMKSFKESMEELREQFDLMTEAEKVSNAQAIAGKRAYNGLLTIINATDEDYQSLSNSINNATGSAERMAQIKLNNFTGQVTLMNSAIDAVKTSIGEQFTPILTELAEIATGIFSGINDFVKRNPALVKALTTAVAVIGLVVGAITAYTVAAKIATVVSTALTAAIPGLNIIMAVAGGIAAIAGAITYFVSEANEGIESVEELTEATRAMDDAFKETEDTYKDTETSVMASAGLASRYTERLKELEEQGLTTAEAQAEYKAIVDKLNMVIPDLNAEIDEQTGLIKGGTDALYQHIDAWKQTALQEAMQTKYEAQMKAWADAELEVYENQTKLNQSLKESAIRQDEINELDKEWERLQEQIYDNLEKGIDIDYQDTFLELEERMGELMEEEERAVKQQENLREAIEEGTGELEEHEKALADAQAVLDAYDKETKIVEDSTEELAKTTDGMNDALYGAYDALEELSMAYRTCYDDAHDSISGQFDLWDEATKVVETSVSSINKNLESQAKYWSDYNANLALLAGKTDSIEGLSEVLNSFADGSADSVNAIAGMANASDEELAKMVENYQTVIKAQDDVASSIAEMNTHYTEQVADLRNNLYDEVRKMNLSEEAAQSGADTLQGFIDGMEGEYPAVQKAFATVASYAKTALGMASGSYPTMTIPAYASGTNYAKQGVALVGEEGPELVYLNGGEKILNAKQTSRGATMGANAPVSINASVTFNIEGKADRATVDALQQYGNEFAQRVLEVVENATTDSRRLAYV